MTREKKDVRKDTHVVWDAYLDKPPVEALQRIYEDAQKSSLEKRDWYWSACKGKKTASILSRGLAFALLVFGTALPLLAGLSDEPGIRLICTQIGIAMLAIAGLTQVADKAFGWSSGWMRYISTVTSMESKTISFELTWAKHMLSKSSVIDSTDVQTLFSMAERFEQDLIKLQVDETSGWITEFNAGINVLYAAIETQREDAKKELDEIRSTAEKARTEAKVKQEASKPGAIDVVLKFKDAPKEVKVILDGKLLEDDFIGASLPLSNMSPGIHTIAIQDSKDTKLQTGRSVLVEADKVVVVEIPLPF